MKEQVKVMARELSEGDGSNMPDGKFKSNGYEKRIEDICETLTAATKELKRNNER